MTRFRGTFEGRTTGSLGVGGAVLLGGLVVLAAKWDQWKADAAHFGSSAAHFTQELMLVAAVVLTVAVLGCVGVGVSMARRRGGVTVHERQPERYGTVSAGAVHSPAAVQASAGQLQGQVTGQSAIAPVEQHVHFHFDGMTREETDERLSAILRRQDGTGSQ